METSALVSQSICLANRQLTYPGCWFTSDKVRLFVNFIPRWLIIITILTLYLRLSFLLRKAHERFISVSDETSRSVEMLSNTPGNVISRDESFYLSSSTDGSCEQGGRTTKRVKIGDQVPVLKKVCTFGIASLEHEIIPVDS